MYWVYEDKPTRTARVPWIPAASAKKAMGTRGGITQPELNRWIGPLESKQEAITTAQNTGFEMSLCQACNP